MPCDIVNFLSENTFHYENTRKLIAHWQDLSISIFVFEERAEEAEAQKKNVKSQQITYFIVIVFNLISIYSFSPHPHCMTRGPYPQDIPNTSRQITLRSNKNKEACYLLDWNGMEIRIILEFSFLTNKFSCFWKSKENLECEEKQS